jgi:hypothetical protein
MYIKELVFLVVRNEDFSSSWRREYLALSGGFRLELTVFRCM